MHKVPRAMKQTFRLTFLTTISVKGGPLAFFKGEEWATCTEIGDHLDHSEEENVKVDAGPQRRERKPGAPIEHFNEEVGKDEDQSGSAQGPVTEKV